MMFTCPLFRCDAHDAARVANILSENVLLSHVLCLQERIRAQLEADRKERAVIEPVVVGSIAQELPGGANVSHPGIDGLLTFFP